MPPLHLQYGNSVKPSAQRKEIITDFYKSRFVRKNKPYMDGMGWYLGGVRYRAHTVLIMIVKDI